MTQALVTQQFTAFEGAANALIDAKRSPHTRMAYRSDLQMWLHFVVENSADPSRPSLMDATRFRDRLRAFRSENTTRRVMASLSSLYRVLLQGGVVAANPFHPSVLAWPSGTKGAKTKLVSDDDAGMMIAACETGTAWRDIRDTAILRVLYDTGLRRESVATLRREHYDPPLLRAIVKGGSEVGIELPIPTVTAINKWLQVCWASPYLFPGDRGHIAVNNINRIVKQRGINVGAKDMHPHRFRAAFATAGYDAELPEYEIQAGMHHKDPATTRRYDRGARGATAATKIAEHRNRKPR